MLQLRGKLVLIDRDVATLYGVETKRVIEAVRNNPDKFPPGYCFSLQKAEAQQLVENFDRFKTMKHSISNHAFTERGLYMLATILKSPRATQTTLAIIDTFVEVREMARTMEALQNVTDGGTEQQSLLQKDRPAPCHSRRQQPLHHLHGDGDRVKLRCSQDKTQVHPQGG